MAEIKKTSAAAPKHLLALNLSKEAEFKKKVEEVKKRPKKGESIQRGVVYVSHLPIGIFEPQLKGYFEQFGTVTRLRLSRSKKTGGSKGYAFVEFECDEVAKIVAETMNNYLISQRLIKCQVIPPEKVHQRLFVGSGRMFHKSLRPDVTRYNRNRTPAQVKSMTDRLVSKEHKLRKRLAEKGIDYDFPGFASQVRKKKLSSDANASVCSQDDTPVCTPSVLEKRKSLRVEDHGDNEDDDDDEIIIKAIQTPKAKGNKKTAAVERVEAASDGSSSKTDKVSRPLKKRNKKTL